MRQSANWATLPQCCQRSSPGERLQKPRHGTRGGLLRGADVKAEAYVVVADDVQVEGEVVQTGHGMGKGTVLRGKHFKEYTGSYPQEAHRLQEKHNG